MKMGEAKTSRNSVGRISFLLEKLSLCYFEDRLIEDENPQSSLYDVKFCGKIVDTYVFIVYVKSSSYFCPKPRLPASLYVEQLYLL